MRPFSFARVEDIPGAIQAQQAAPASARNTASVHAPAQYIAGGTTLLDLMKLDVMRPEVVTDINALQGAPFGRIDHGPAGLRLGAMVRMASAAEHPSVLENYPVIAQSLALAASPQLRNMASLAGNVLQRTRCTYFRDVSYAACNKRDPGSGCAALAGVNRSHAIVGVSDQCIASYAGDFAHALIALDAGVELVGPGGSRTIPFAELHRMPGNTPHTETTLLPAELIAAFTVPSMPWARRSLYLKIRDRESYEFALASAAVALDLDGERARDVRIALGGVSAKPWRASEAEEMLKGQRLDEAALSAAADKAFETAQPKTHNGFKLELGKRTLVRALRQAASMEI